MKIKLDENLSLHLKPLLEQEGHDTASAAEEGLLGQCDAKVASAARTEGRVLFTLDVEFADLRKFAPGSHSGVVLFRPGRLEPCSVNAFVLRFVKKTDLTKFSGCIVVVDPRRVRVRAPQAVSDR